MLIVLARHKIQQFYQNWYLCYYLVLTKIKNLSVFFSRDGIKIVCTMHIFQMLMKSLTVGSKIRNVIIDEVLVGEVIIFTMFCRNQIHIWNCFFLNYNIYISSKKKFLLSTVRTTFITKDFFHLLMIISKICLQYNIGNKNYHFL